MVNIHKVASLTECSTLSVTCRYLPGALRLILSPFSLQSFLYKLQGFSLMNKLRSASDLPWRRSCEGCTKMEPHFLLKLWYKQAFLSTLCCFLKPLPESEPAALVLQMCCFLHDEILQTGKKKNLLKSGKHRGNCWRSVMHHRTN